MEQITQADVERVKALLDDLEDDTDPMAVIDKVQETTRLTFKMLSAYPVNNENVARRAEARAAIRHGLEVLDTFELLALAKKEEK